MKVIAVTGTSGKTTTVTLIADILQEAGGKVGLLCSTHFRINDKEWVNDTKQTTLGRFGLNRIIRDMADAGCEYLILEVTSHALTQSRTCGIPIHIAVLTNISADHIEYHGGAAAYKMAKYRLFQNVRNAIVLNRDDEHFVFFDRAYAPHKLYFGLKKGHVHTESINYAVDHTIFPIVFPSGQSMDIHFRLVSETNVYNALAASAAAYSAGVSKEIIKRALERISGMPGRYEAIDENQPFIVIVDYAHHPSALEQLCAFYKSVTRGRLIIVFGATGGGRDKAKRPVMGEIADKLCDYIIVTDDDPYTENRLQIIEDIVSGIKNKKDGETFWKMPDRKSAIEFALKKLAREGDTVIIAGKGCEPVQVTAQGKIPWDDREVAREILKQLS